LRLKIIDQSFKTLRKNRHKIRIIIIFVIEKCRVQIGITAGIEIPKLALVVFSRRRRYLSGKLSARGA